MAWAMVLPLSRNFRKDFCCAVSTTFLKPRGASLGRLSFFWKRFSTSWLSTCWSPLSCRARITRGWMSRLTLADQEGGDSLGSSRMVPLRQPKRSTKRSLAWSWRHLLRSLTETCC